jgi:hypothetical protein
MLELMASSFDSMLNHLFSQNFKLIRGDESNHLIYILTKNAKRSLYLPMDCLFPSIVCLFLSNQKLRQTRRYNSPIS